MFNRKKVSFIGRREKEGEKSAHYFKRIKCSQSGYIVISFISV